MQKRTKTQMNPDAVVRRGYLVENFRVFHLDSIEKEAIPSHFHAFHKIILVRKGSLRYIVEGCSCEVSPGQILLVPAFSIHQPVIAPEAYERIVLWISPEAPELEEADDGLKIAESERQYVLTDDVCREIIGRIACETEKKQASADREGMNPLYAREKYASALLTQLMVLLGRKLQEESLETKLFGQWEKKGSMQEDPLMKEIIFYINHNPENDLSASGLAKRCYLSAGHLSRRFQEATGCSLHQYVLQKRLIRAAGLIRQGSSALEACQRSGFSDYSTFFRAFKKAFEIGPQEFAGRRKE